MLLQKLGNKVVLFLHNPFNTIIIRTLGIFFYQFSPNLLNGRSDEYRTRSKQSL